MVAVPLVVAALAGFARGAQKPERWQPLVHEGCRFAVPASWRATEDTSAVFAPDGSNLSVRMFRITNWSTHKTQIKAAYGRVKILHEDSERRLWFEIGDKPRVQHYIEVANGLAVCSGLLEIRATTPDAEDTTKRIADSIGPAPGK
jgi:hypothetical protein